MFNLTNYSEFIIKVSYVSFVFLKDLFKLEGRRIALVCYDDGLLWHIVNTCTLDADLTDLKWMCLATMEIWFLSYFRCSYWVLKMRIAFSLFSICAVMRAKICSALQYFPFCPVIIGKIRRSRKYIVWWFDSAAISNILFWLRCQWNNGWKTFKEVATIEIISYHLMEPLGHIGSELWHLAIRALKLFCCYYNTIEQFT